MSRMRGLGLFLGVTAGLAQGSIAQPVGTELPDPARAASTAQMSPASLTVPALTPVEIVFDVELGSKISKSGETFEIFLSAPIMVDGKVLVPAGTRGIGEVIHAKKAGGSGAPGELVLAARYLTLGARQLRLRSLNYEGIGKDKMALSTAVTVGAGPFGMLIKGGEKIVAKGSLGHAKTAELFVIDAPAPVREEPSTVGN